MQASEQIDNLVASLTDWRGTVFASIRRIIRDADPEMIEEWKWMGTPVWSHDGIVCLANPCKDKVKITFQQGAHLADPDKLFNNELAGKLWRSIDLYKGDTINESSLKALINSAVDYNRAKVKTAATKPRTARRAIQKEAAE